MPVGADEDDYDIFIELLLNCYPYGTYRICNAEFTQKFPAIVTDWNGGAVVTWEDYRYFYGEQSDIYAQAIHVDEDDRLQTEW